MSDQVQIEWHENLAVVDFRRKNSVTDTAERLKKLWTPKTWGQAVEYVLYEFWLDAEEWAMPISSIEYNRLYEDQNFTRLGSTALYERIERAIGPDIEGDVTGDISLLLNDIVRRLENKQRDYGPLNILRFGQMGLEVRLWDKLARLSNLKGQQAKNEPLDDTVLDIIGYTVIMVMLEAGWFILPLEVEND